MTTTECTGERIKLMRKQRGLTQEELAHLLNRNSNLLARWERGEVKLKTETIINLARALGTSSSYLLGETDNPENLQQADAFLNNDLNKTIAAGFNGTHYEIYNGNTNQTIRIPDNPEGRKIFLEFTRDILNLKQPVVSNTINGDNIGNQIGVVNN